MKLLNSYFFCFLDFFLFLVIISSNIFNIFPVGRNGLFNFSTRSLRKAEWFYLNLSIQEYIYNYTWNDSKLIWVYLWLLPWIWSLEIPRATPCIAGKVNMGHQVIKLTLEGGENLSNWSEQKYPSFTIAKESYVMSAKIY